MRTKRYFMSGVMMAGVVFANTQIAAAQSQHEKWGRSDSWTIQIDPEVGNGCYMEKTFEDGTLVQIGFVPDREGGFFAAYNPAWTSLEDRVTGTLRFDFGATLFGGEYIGVVTKTHYGGYAFFNNPKFVTELGKRNEVTISGSNGSALNLSLKGTSKAINAVRSCDAEQVGD